MSHQCQHWGASSTISQAQLRKRFRQREELAATGHCRNQSANGGQRRTGKIRVEAGAIEGSIAVEMHRLV